VFKSYCPKDERSTLQIKKKDVVIGLLQNKAKCLEDSAKATQQIKTH